MRGIILLILFSAVAGTLAGAAMAYIDVGPVQSIEIAAGDGPAQASPADSSKSPKLYVESEEHDFGRMQRGTKKSHVFVIENRGEAPLRLQTGRPSCKCTVGELSKNVLQPGESVDLKVEWEAKVSEGPFRQTVPVTSNDPHNSRIELSVAGEVTSLTGLVPRELAFGKIRAGEEQTAEVILMAYLQDEIEVSKAEISKAEDREHFDISVTPLSTDNLPDEKATAAVSIKATAKPDLPIGSFLQWVSLETNLQDAENLEVPISGRVVGDISIAGRGWNEEQGILNLGQVISSEGKEANLNLIIRNAASDDVQFEVAEISPPALEVELGEPKKIKHVVHVPLKVEVPIGTNPMVHLNSDTHEPAVIKLKTNHPQAPELTLNVRFAVQR